MSGGKTVVVPFGKYKGKPVEEFLADSDYVEWCKAQEWFRRFAKMLLPPDDQSSMERTPVHNRMQNAFLDDAYCLSFATHMASEARLRQALDDCRGLFRQSALNIRARLNQTEIHTSPELADDLTLLAEWNERQASELTFHTKIKREFEVGGMDVVLEVDVHAATPLGIFRCNSEKMDTNDRYFGLVKTHHTVLRKVLEPYVRRAREDQRNPPEFAFGICMSSVEIKPLLGEDYPVVLRTIKRRPTRPGYEHKVLLVGEFAAESTTIPQIRKIFAESGVRVVFAADVAAHHERTLVRPLLG